MNNDSQRVLAVSCRVAHARYHASSKAPQHLFSPRWYAMCLWHHALNLVQTSNVFVIIKHVDRRLILMAPPTPWARPSANPQAECKAGS